MFIIRKILFCLLLVLSLCINVLAANFKQGSQGDGVKKVQTKLINWGYMSGSADGIFGSSTKKGVINFQKKNGLTADGVVGSATKRALGISTTSNGSSASRDEDIYLLARIISAEARGEPYEGQVAVGAVVLNRVAHPSFPNSLSGVIYQKGAFTAIVDGQFDEPISDSAYRAAEDAMNGWDPSGGAIYYYNPIKSTSEWIFTREVITVIGKHKFAI